MQAGDTDGIRRHAAGAGRRAFLAFVCLIIAPIASLWIAGKLPNPPGNGPGGLQVVFGIAVPAVLASGATAVTQVPRLEAVLWVLAALVATFGLLVLTMLLVARID